jgi:hypothetical protein
MSRDLAELASNALHVLLISTGDSSAGFTRWLLIDGQVLGRDEG